MGDGPDKWAAPLGYAVLTVASWALRPLDRRITPRSRGIEPRVRAWIAPLIVIAVLTIVSLVTLPGPTGY